MSTAQWQDLSWQVEALAWAEQQLAGHGLTIVGDAEQRIRPWATVFRLPTDRGNVWFKASASGTAYEPGLLDVLRRADSRHLLEPIALDVTRGWSLLPDGGMTLRRHLKGAPQERFGRWGDALAAYAEVQRESEALLGELLAVGVPDLRPAAVPGQVEQLLATHPMDDGLRRRVADLVPALAAACHELDSSPVSAAIQHDDLHDDNVLVHPDGYRFFDWGDASVAHPFATFLIVRRSVATSAGIDESDARITRLADGYLEAFTDLAPLSALRRMLSLAEYVAAIGRVESWRRAMLTATERETAEYEYPVTAWLDELTTMPVPASLPRAGS